MAKHRQKKDGLHPALWQMAQLFDPLDDVVAWVKDRHGCYCWVNRAFLVNYSMRNAIPMAGLQQILGKTDYDFCPPFLADQYRLDDEQVLSGKRITDRIELVDHGTHINSWHVTNKMPVMDLNGSIVGTAGMTRPIKMENTERLGGFPAVLNHMQQQFRSNISNTQMAKLAGLSTRTFERKFLSLFHLPPQTYLRKLRLRIACRALVYSKESIVEIALKCGFADQSHFTREFRKQFGSPPREYREHYSQKAAASVTKNAVPGQ